MSVQERASRVKSRLIDHIARVDLRVRDVEAALSFYRDIVGLEVADRDTRHASLGAGGGPAFLRLDSTGVSEPADATATGLFHSAIRFPTRAALGDALARLVDAGLEIGAGDHLVSEALYVDDPDHNGVELYWDRPEEQWPPPTDEMLVPMATLAVDLQGLLKEGSGRAALNEKAPPGTDMGHVHLQVSDLDETVRFYASELGLDVTGKLGNNAAFFSSNGYHHHIGANTWRSSGRGPAGKQHAGLDRVVFAVREVREPATVSDPDGIALEFAAL